MHLSHAAIWVRDLEGMRGFYERHLGARSGEKYENPAKGFESYFLSFDSGARLELMRKEGVDYPASSSGDPTRLVISDQIGFAHLAFSVGSEAGVDELTTRLEREGVSILSGPRRTGDGYYESLIADLEGNSIEITV